MSICTVEAALLSQYSGYLRCGQQVGAQRGWLSRADDRPDHAPGHARVLQVLPLEPHQCERGISNACQPVDDWCRYLH